MPSNVEIFLEEYEALALRCRVQIMPCQCAPPALDYCELPYEKRMLKEVIKQLKNTECASFFKARKRNSDLDDSFEDQGEEAA